MKGLCGISKFVFSRRLPPEVDPLLGSYEVRGGGPRSIREQMRLARALVCACSRRGVFEPSLFPDDKPRLLIVGGGVAGFAAAYKAAELNIVVTVIESSDTYFKTQAGCSSRWLHPYEYDWPLGHYGEGNFPLLPTEISRFQGSLKWQADVSSIVASEWNAQVTYPPNNLAAKKNVKLQVKNQDIRSVFDPKQKYPVIFVATGFKERALKGAFKGYQYWSTDQLESHNLGLQSGVPIRILVSGGGDGGIQDILRIMCLRSGSYFSAGELISKLHPLMAFDPQYSSFFGSEKVLRRPNRLSPNTTTPKYKRIDDIAKALIFNSGQDYDAFRDFFLTKIHPGILSGRMKLTLAFQGDHIGSCFTLNYLLFALVNQFLKLHGSAMEILTKTELERVDSGSGDHICAESYEASACYGSPHIAHLISEKATFQREFEIILIRHGAVNSQPSNTTAS